MAARSPMVMFPPLVLDTIPTSVGPDEQPKSPASAKNANMAVPPPGRDAADMLKVPGQKIPTEKPKVPQAKRPM